MTIDATISGNFYATAAQVIPLLFVALIVEYRFVDPNAYSRGGNAITQLFVVGALGLGEAAALRALYYGEASHTSKTVVAASLAIGGFWVWYSPILTILRLAIARRRSALARHVIAIAAPAIPVAYLGVVVYALLKGV